MPSPERGFIERGVEISKKFDIVTGVIGILIANAPLVAFSLLSYMAGDEIQNRISKYIQAKFIRVLRQDLAMRKES